MTRKYHHSVFFVILLCFLITTIAGAEERAETIGFFVTNESCCGEDSDPHAVHGIEVLGGGVVLAGKNIDLGNSHDGFVIKFPKVDEEEGNVWLLPGEDLSFDWVFSFGTEGKEDAANSTAILDNYVFVAGLTASKEEVLERYLAKLELSTGELLWQKTFPSKKNNRDSAFESAQITDNNGLILTGVSSAKRGSIEGFKSYGNPSDGHAFSMYFEESQLLGNVPPEKPVWEINFKNALTGKTIKQHIDDRSFVIASSTKDEPSLAKIIKIDQNGNTIWSKTYPNHGEVTDIAVSTIDGVVDGYFISGHKSVKGIGIDGSITKLSINGDIIWSNTYGNPVGGKNKFNVLGRGNEKFIYDECWGIESMNDGGAIMACGTGTHCDEFEENKKLFQQCIKDPRETWRSLLIRVNKRGELIWESADSFIEEDEVITTASEYIISTYDGKLISVLDLAFGFGVQIIKLEY